MQAQITKSILELRQKLIKKRSVDHTHELVNTMFAYEDKPPILHNCNLQTATQGVTAITGENGSGKTTVLKLLARYKEPQEGTVLPKGSEIKIGFSASDASDLNPFLRCSDVIMMIRDSYQINSISPEVLQLIGLDRQHYSTRVRKLSSGQAKKLSLLRSFLVGRDLLLLDEPDSHLDLPARTIISNLVSELSKQIPIVLTSHDIRFIESCTPQKMYQLVKSNVLDSAFTAQPLEMNSISNYYQITKKGD